MARKHTTRLILLVLLLAGCDGAEPSTVADPVSVVGDPHASCANGEKVASGQADGDRTLSGDVDGDGAEDRAWLSSDPSAAEGCKFFLTVETTDRVYWASTASGVPSSLQEPTLNSLSNIDGEAGSEIIVNLEAGASTQFVGAFMLTRAGLERITVDGRGPGPFGGEIEGLFAYGGSVGHLEAVDCVDDHVVLSAAIPSGAAGTYEVERRFFSPSLTALVLEKDLTEKYMVRDLKVDDFPEFAGSPFLSCD